MMQFYNDVFYSHTRFADSVPMEEYLLRNASNSQVSFHSGIADRYFFPLSFRPPRFLPPPYFLAPSTPHAPPKLQASRCHANYIGGFGVQSSGDGEANKQRGEIEANGRIF